MSNYYARKYEKYKRKNSISELERWNQRLLCPRPWDSIKEAWESSREHKFIRSFIQGLSCRREEGFDAHAILDIKRTKEFMAFIKSVQSKLRNEFPLHTFVSILFIELCEHIKNKDVPDDNYLLDEIDIKRGVIIKAITVIRHYQDRLPEKLRKINSIIQKFKATKLNFNDVNKTNSADNWVDLCIMRNAIDGNKQGVVRKLINITPLDKLDKLVQPSLNHAVCKNNIDMVQLLLDENADINYISPSGENTPLHTAIDTGNTEMIDFLLENTIINLSNRLESFPESREEGKNIQMKLIVFNENCKLLEPYPEIIEKYTHEIEELNSAYEELIAISNLGG